MLLVKFMEEESKGITKVEKYDFIELALFFRKISKKSKHEDKRNLLETLWKLFPRKESLFPLMRLILPQLDLSRPNYGIGIKSIIPLYIKSIPLTKESRDAKKLLHYKSPIYAQQFAGDFGNVLYSVLQKRCCSKGTKTIYDVNNDLNNLIKCANQKVCLYLF